MPLESANMPRDDGRLTWMAAARMGDIKLLELYFSEGVDVNDKEPNGFSALHIAALYNNVDLARHLISIGASAKSTNNWNDTPLHRAATCGYAEMCKLLLEAGADPDFEDWRNKTPADYAKEEVSDHAPVALAPLLRPLLLLSLFRFAHLARACRVRSSNVRR